MDTNESGAVGIRIDENKTFRDARDDPPRFTATDLSEQDGVSRREFLELASAGATAGAFQTAFSARQAGPEARNGIP